MRWNKMCDESRQFVKTIWPAHNRQYDHWENFSSKLSPQRRNILHVVTGVSRYLDRQMTWAVLNNLVPISPRHRIAHLNKCIHDSPRIGRESDFFGIQSQESLNPREDSRFRNSNNGGIVDNERDLCEDSNESSYTNNFLSFEQMYVVSNVTLLKETSNLYVFNVEYY
jgi:hypothetical protein